MQYEIRVGTHLDPHFQAWFDGLSLTHETDGTTTIVSSIVDQAALHGVLHALRDLGVPLVSVRPVDDGRARTPEGN